MQQVDSISLATVQEKTESMEAKYGVMLEGKSTGIIVSERVLNAAAQVDNSRYVIFLSEDVIFEEFLRIILFDVNEGIKEDISLGTIYYVTGFFEDFSVTEDSINFKFLGKYIWTLKVSRYPRWRFPFFSGLFSAVHRKAGLKKYMTLTATPIPEKPD